MVTKSILAEQVKRLLGESEASRYDIREVKLAVGQARDYRIRADYFESAREEREIPHEYLSVYDSVEVLRDEVRRRDYIALPANYLRLPKGRGIFSIAPLGNETMVFAQSEAGSGALLKHHPAFRTEGTVAYYPEGRKAWFRRDICRLYPLLTVKLVRPSETFHDEEELPIPADMQAAIVQDALGMLRGKPAPDKVNDSTDTQ